MTQLTNNIRDNIKLLKQEADKVYSDNQIIRDLVITQGILESAILRGTPSSLALRYNNLFGIKGIGTGLLVNGKIINRVLLPTHEYYPGQGMIEVDQSFAVNATIEDSFKQHRLLLEKPRYAPCWDCMTFKEIADCIRKCGYATDPNYSLELENIHHEFVE